MSFKFKRPHAARWVAAVVVVTGALAAPAISPAQTASTTSTGGSAFAPEPPPAPAATPAPAGSVATIDSNGRAIAPADAPLQVKRIIAAGNRIAFKPYVYGGGHRRWRDRGYDCSGSVSYALRGAKLLKSPLASYDFFNWGEQGAGQWVTLYTKSSHMYMVVAGLRFDTSGRSGNRGTRWHTDMRSARGYKLRHPEGL